MGWRQMRWSKRLPSLTVAISDGRSEGTFQNEDFLRRDLPSLEDISNDISETFRNEDGKSLLDDFLYKMECWAARSQGAYTGVCSQQHVPSYIKLADELKGKGVDKIVCVSVNDPYVMNAWAENLKAKPQDLDVDYNCIGFICCRKVPDHRSHDWFQRLLEGYRVYLSLMGSAFNLFGSGYGIGPLLPCSGLSKGLGKDLERTWSTVELDKGCGATFVGCASSIEESLSQQHIMDQGDYDDLIFIFSEFSILVTHLLDTYSELFGFESVSGRTMGIDDVPSSYTTLLTRLIDVPSSSTSTLARLTTSWDLDEDEEFSKVLVARNLSLQWLVHDDLDNYADKQQWWVKPRSTTWYYEFLLSYYQDDRWLENMRMTRNMFSALCDIVGPSIRKQDTNYRKAIPVFARVGAAVYKLVSGLGFLKISESFAMGKTSTKRVLNEVCLAVGETMGHLITFPSGQALLDVMHAFHDECGLPNVAGAIDVTHIAIKAPNTGFYRDYFKNMKYSMCLQAVVDTSWRFKDIYVGMLGSVNDTRVLKYSSLWRRACERAVLNEDPLMLPWRVNVRPYLLGDSGYPVLSWLQKPVRHLAAGGQVTREEHHFNIRHRRGRRHVEQAFGLLKKVFREMGQPTELGVEFLPSVVNTCCIIHNYMIEKQENDFQEVLREWELDVGAVDGVVPEENQDFNIINQDGDWMGNLVGEELAGLQ